MILFADRQDITRVGLMHLADSMEEATPYRYVEDKASLVEALKETPDAAVFLDYTMFDISELSDLIIITQRFRQSQWVLFSETLSYELMSQAVASTRQIGIVLKDAPIGEIREAMLYALHHQRYICQRIAEMLLNPPTRDEQKPELANLTRTETEILKLIALGLTTKEIAERRFSSFHTINTHRKNIFRKLSVNNAHEATKLALRAGIVDSAEYYI